ncbi:MAG: DUF1961 family protein [Melioribacteraceae bacterium]|nr:DUF1961 family protein [Melioribacteraceae bacterium]
MVKIKRESQESGTSILQRLFQKTVINIIIALVVLSGAANSSDLFGGNKQYSAALTDTTNFTIDGPHRFPTISGLKGFRPTSMQTKAFIETEAHHSNKGTISLWFSPLEDLANWKTKDWVFNRVENAFVYPFFSNFFPARNGEKKGFGLFWETGYKPLLFNYNTEPTNENIASKVSYGNTTSPLSLWAEDMTILKGMWYHVVITWDKKKKEINMYVNGFHVAHIEKTEFFTDWGDRLYIGNPMFVMRNLQIEGGVISKEEAGKIYSESRPVTNDPADEILRDKFTVVDRPSLDIKLDDTWQKSYECSFLEKDDLDGWVFQTGDKYKDLHVVKITDEGLLIDTPDFSDHETRMYLWSPVTFEGDQWIEFEFMPEEDDGLMLLLVASSGPQRNDFIDDNQISKSGKMGFLIGQNRNYHWELMRKYPDLRKNVETQFFAKNPWGKMMHYGAADRIEVGKWHKLRFVLIGNRLHGSIDGKTVFDVEDKFDINNGPVLDFGRIGFRHMYNTTVRYRNFIVYERNIKK